MTTNVGWGYRMDKHTKGPWEVGKRTHQGYTRYTIETEDGLILGQMRYSNNPRCTESHAEANARLFAKAPEMLEALTSIVNTERKAYDRRVKCASSHNNTDGVGIAFDYTSPDPLPAWFEAAEQLLASLEGDHE